MRSAKAGSDTMAHPALAIAQNENAALVVSFIRQVALSYKVEAETRLTLYTDPAAQATIPPDIWERIAGILIKQFRTNPVLAREADRLGLP